MTSDASMGNGAASVTLRLLEIPTPADIEGLIALYRQAGWWEGGDNAALAARIVAGSHCVVVARSAGQIVGMGRAISDGASDAYLQDITVAAAFRRRGIATQIIGLLLQRLEADGLGWVALIAETGSHDLYPRLGFRPMAGAVPMLRRP
jgi:spermidine synthase